MAPIENPYVNREYCPLDIRKGNECIKKDVNENEVPNGIKYGLLEKFVRKAFKGIIAKLERGTIYTQADVKRESGSIVNYILKYGQKDFTYFGTVTFANSLYAALRYGAASANLGDFNDGRAIYKVMYRYYLLDNTVPGNPPLTDFFKVSTFESYTAANALWASTLAPKLYYPHELAEYYLFTTSKKDTEEARQLEKKLSSNNDSTRMDMYRLMEDSRREKKFAYLHYNILWSLYNYEENYPGDPKILPEYFERLGVQRGARDQNFNRVFREFAESAGIRLNAEPKNPQSWIKTLGNTAIMVNQPWSRDFTGLIDTHLRNLHEQHDFSDAEEILGMGSTRQIYYPNLQLGQLELARHSYRLARYQNTADRDQFNPEVVGYAKKIEQRQEEIKTQITGSLSQYTEGDPGYWQNINQLFFLAGYQQAMERPTEALKVYDGLFKANIVDRDVLRNISLGQADALTMQYEHLADKRFLDERTKVKAKVKEFRYIFRPDADSIPDELRLMGMEMRSAMVHPEGADDIFQNMQSTVTAKSGISYRYRMFNSNLQTTRAGLHMERGESEEALALLTESNSGLNGQNLSSWNQTAIGGPEYKRWGEDQEFARELQIAGIQTASWNFGESEAILSRLSDPKQYAFRKNLRDEQYLRLLQTRADYYQESGQPGREEAIFNLRFARRLSQLTPNEKILAGQILNRMLVRAIQRRDEAQIKKCTQMFDQLSLTAGTPGHAQLLTEQLMQRAEWESRQDNVAGAEALLKKAGEQQTQIFNYRLRTQYGTMLESSYAGLYAGKRNFGKAEEYYDKSGKLVVDPKDGLFQEDSQMQQRLTALSSRLTMNPDQALADDLKSEIRVAERARGKYSDNLIAQRLERYIWKLKLLSWRLQQTYHAGGPDVPNYTGELSGEFNRIFKGLSRASRAEKEFAAEYIQTYWNEVRRAGRTDYNSMLNNLRLWTNKLKENDPYFRHTLPPFEDPRPLETRTHHSGQFSLEEFKKIEAQYQDYFVKHVTLETFADHWPEHQETIFAELEKQGYVQKRDKRGSAVVLLTPNVTLEDFLKKFNPVIRITEKSAAGTNLVVESTAVGYRVTWTARTGQTQSEMLRADNPDAVIVDEQVLPSLPGVDSKATREKLQEAGIIDAKGVLLRRPEAKELNNPEIIIVDSKKLSEEEAAELREQYSVALAERIAGARSEIQRLNLSEADAEVVRNMVPRANLDRGLIYEKLITAGSNFDQMSRGEKTQIINNYAGYLISRGRPADRPEIEAVVRLLNFGEENPAAAKQFSGNGLYHNALRLWEKMNQNAGGKYPLSLREKQNGYYLLLRLKLSADDDEGATEIIKAIVRSANAYTPGKPVELEEITQLSAYTEEQRNILIELWQQRFGSEEFIESVRSKLSQLGYGPAAE